METNSERRRRKLAELCAERGIAAVAKSAGLNWQSLDQVIKGALLPPKKDGTRSPKNLGNDAAQKIEVAQGLGVGWFDTATHASFVNAGTPENQPNVVVTHVQQAQTAINNAALSADALRLAGFLDRITDTDQRFRAYCECMALITTRLDRTEQSSLHGSLAQREMSIGESPYHAATGQKPQTMDIGHHAR